MTVEVRKAVRVLEDEVLSEMRRASIERGWGFSLGFFEAEEIPREIARGVLRTLRAEGFVEPVRGLWSEDGEPRGAGYALTERGWQRGGALCGYDDAKPDSKKVYGGDGSVPF